ncbi:MAG: response regulator transcription factor, partial [Chloroflexi bacterium]|nr:response regulator transcription factor [Chloroflexota bacterium]
MAKILLIEDDRTMLGLLKTLLEIEGFQVSTIGDGHGIDPLQTIRQEQPDAILLDVHLRFMDGLNL